jgi:hypothetical protein
MDWIFQCNPKRYDLALHLEKGTQTDGWAINQRRELASPGDRVFFWQTGPNARLLAIGHVNSPVYERESSFGRYRADVVFDYRIAPPVTRPEMLEDKALSTFAPFKGMMGTNFPVNDAEISAALDNIVQGRLEALSKTVSLTATAQLSVYDAVKKANQQVELRLREYISTMDPIGFEWLVRALLLELGYTEVTVTKPSGDGGVDLRAKLATAGLAEIRICIQAKRQQSVGSPAVQAIRGSLNAHEAGMLITSGQFTQGAITEANDPRKLPITLVNGGQLVKLLLERGIGVELMPLKYYVLKLDEISKEKLEAFLEIQSAPDL